MNNTDCSPVNSKVFEYRLLPTLYILVFIIGVAANGWGMKFLLQKLKKFKIVNVFVLNLGLANILYLQILPFLVVYYFMDGKWIFGDAFCKITRFCFNLNLYGSIGFLTCISVYRYLTVVHPVRVMGRITVTHSVIISVMVWFLVSVQCLPDMFFVKTTYINSSGTCFHTTTRDYVEDYLKYSLGWTITGFLVPFLITVGCYGHIAVVLWTIKKIDKVQKQRSLRLLFILILLFCVCYIPYHVLTNFNLYSRGLLNQDKCPPWNNAVFSAHQISRGLVCLNSALNPLIYLHRNENIAARFRKWLVARPGLPSLVLSESGSRSLGQAMDEV